MMIYVRCQLYFFIKGDFYKYKSDYIKILELYMLRYSLLFALVETLT